MRIVIHNNYTISYACMSGSEKKRERRQESKGGRFIKDKQIYFHRLNCFRVKLKLGYFQLYEIHLLPQ